MKRSFECLLCLLMLQAFCFQAAGQIRSNIVVNGSFEDQATMEGWSFGSYISHPWEYQAYDGFCYIVVLDTMSQTLTTVPGMEYELRFAAGSGRTLRVHWGAQQVDVTMSLPVGGLPNQSWSVTSLVFTATSDRTPLTFEATIESYLLDAVEAGFLQKEPLITVPVPGRSTFEGGGACFSVGAIGAAPLQYQWHKDNEPVAGATTRFLMLTNLSTADAGNYWVRVTNQYGSISSLRAGLMVHSIPNVPLIVAQPKPQSTLEGYFAGVYAIAFGAEPLFYQWRLDGTDIVGATNASYSIEQVSSANSGEYSVLVSNHFGSVLSVGAALNVTTGALGGGSTLLANRYPGILSAPVFDVDEVTLVKGTNFVAQLYAGATPGNLHPVGAVTPFMSSLGGYFRTTTRVVPDVPAGQTAYLQIRVWDYETGETFEEAQARGGRFGKSNMWPLTLGNVWDPPLPGPYLRSFSLQAGMSLLATAKFERGIKLPGGGFEWVLIGDPGYLYVVESRTPPNDWLPVLTLTNATGSAVFSDPEGQNASLKFYRARILDQ